MPQRFLKPGLRTSLRFNKCGRPARLFYVMLLTLADDWGRYEGGPQILRSECFPLDDDVRIPDLIKWLDELESQGLILRYEIDGVPYIQLQRWKERVRSNPRFPDPPDPSLVNAKLIDVRQESARKCAQLRAVDGAGSSHGKEEESEEEKTPRRDSLRGGMDSWENVSGQFPLTHQGDDFKAAWEAWIRHRREKHQKLTPTTVQRQAKKLGSMSPADAIVTINHSIEQGYTGLFPPSVGGSNSKGTNSHGSTGPFITGKRIKRPQD